MSADILFCSKTLLGLKMQVSEEEGKTEPKWSSKPLQWPQVDPRLSDMLNRFTLTLFAIFAFLPHLLWCSLASISYLSFQGIKKKSCSDFLETHYLVQSVWKAPPESCTSGSQYRMMSRLALTQSSPHREFLREVGCALFSLPVPPWHLPAVRSLWDPFEGARASSIEDVAQQIPISLTEQVGEEAPQTPSKHL